MKISSSIENYTFTANDNMIATLTSSNVLREISEKINLVVENEKNNEKKLETKKLLFYSSDDKNIRSLASLLMIPIYENPPFASHLEIELYYDPERAQNETFDSKTNLERYFFKFFYQEKEYKLSYCSPTCTLWNFQQYHMGIISSSLSEWIRYCTESSLEDSCPNHYFDIDQAHSNFAAMSILFSILAGVLSGFIIYLLYKRNKRNKTLKNRKNIEKEIILN